jgi:hypothetical protein
MTLFHEKMTPLFQEAPVSVSDWRESTFSMPGNGGLQHYYRGGSFGAQAGGCPEKGGREMSLAPLLRLSGDFPTGWIDNSGIQSCQGGQGGVQSTEAVLGSDHLFFWA